MFVSSLTLLLFNFYLFLTLISINKFSFVCLFDSFYSLVLLNYIILYTDRKFCCQSTSLFTTTAHAHIKFAYISEIANNDNDHNYNNKLP